METYTGSCLCGDVAFRVVGALAPIQVCHCRQCRKAQGSAFAANTPVREEALLFERGRDLIREFESSAGKWRAFCSQCGSPVYSRHVDAPGVFRIRVGLLNEPLDVRPESHAFVASKADWWRIDDHLPRFEGARSSSSPVNTEAQNRPARACLDAAVPQLPTGDIETSADFFVTRLGFQVIGKFPEHGHLIVRRDDAELHFWRAESEQQARRIASASSCYLRVRHIEALFDALQALGTPFRFPLTRQPWGMHEMQVDDPYGNAIRFGEPLD